MRWRVATAVVLLGLTFPATSGAPLPAAPTAPPPPDKALGLAFEPSANHWRLTFVDTRSLEPVSGPRVVVGRWIGDWAFSSDRSRIAIGTESTVGIFDSASLRQLARLRPTGSPAAVAWPRANRVLAVSSWGQPSRLEIAAFDPNARRVVRRSKMPGTLLRAARAPDGLVVLVGPARGVGPARLIVVRARGAVRSVSLDVVAGQTQPTSAPYVFDRRIPGLAVDPSRGRALVVLPERRVVEVDLATLAVQEHDVSAPKSLLGRFFDWLEPAAQAKAMNGPVRSARWLGNGLLAVTGSDAAATIRDGRIVGQTFDAAGLALIDTATWSARPVDDRVSGLVAAGDLLLASGSEPGVGLIGYEHDGDKRFQLFAGRYPWISAVVGGRAFVGFGGNAAQDLSIVDLATGDVVVGRRAGIVPQLLLDDANPWTGS